MIHADEEDWMPRLKHILVLNLQEEHLALEGMHPVLGATSAHQLLATWAAQDQAHLVQISRTPARQLKPEIGPWAAFFSVMQ